MSSIRSRRVLAAVSGGLGFALVLTACAGSSSTSSSKSAGAGGTDCAAYKTYGDLKGKTISVYTGIVTPEDQAYIESYKPFEECTGANEDLRLEGLVAD